VEILNDGHVTSCLYEVHKDIEVILPEELEMKILSSQYELTKTVWSNPSKSAELAPLPYGLAIDIGTTTMAFYIVNLLFGTVVDVKTSVNPQSKFGADVISRINYGAENEEGVRNLQSVLINSINKTIAEYCNESGIAYDDFVKVSVVGNTTMLHNFMGVDALSIAHAPFKPIFTDVQTMTAKEIGINIHEEGEIILSPSLSGYVGADIVAGLASLDESKIGKKFLFIDIGTNGEMALVTPSKILACATAAGPAFEGANISKGMSATKGAISKFSNGKYEVIGGVEPVGICGSGLIDIVANLVENEVLGMDGNITKEIVIKNHDTLEDTDVSLTQQDVREIQLAKSAIASGINRMLAIAGLDISELDNIYLAGGFGNYINIESAIRIGLLPDIDLNKYVQIGNTAGTGAVLALKSQDFVRSMNELITKMEYIELSTDEEFSMEFAMNMFF
jgi:uncharacterized 2Fe-2S/4Fe-4S cluster protein (DUF4445 family)